MTLPLSDIRVLDYSQGLAGPYASMLLADQGAEVIKIEPPDREAPSGAQANSAYLTFNRNKRSIFLDANRPKGRELFDGLLRWADVLVINMRVNARQRRGVTYEDLSAINPRLIYASITAYGEAGPDAYQPGFDVAVQARVGDVAGRRPPGGPMPLNTSLFHYDMTTAMLTAYAVMLALHERERTGRGQKIEANLLKSALALQSIQMFRASGSSEMYPVLAARVRSVYLCSDGRYIFAISGGVWERFCRATELDALVADPRFDTAEKRTQQAKELTEILARHFSARPAAEWEAMLKAGDSMASVVRDVSEVYDDPQVIANQMIIQFEQPGIGTVEAVNVPITMSGTADEPPIRRHIPERGEHTLEVLREMGHSLEEIEALKAEGALG